MVDVKSTKEATHPKYNEMIATAIETLREKGGSSRVAIIKFITSKYKVSDNSNAVNSRVKLALKKSVASGALTQVKGTGASGSFKLAEKPKKVVKSPKATKSPKKVKARKVAKKAVKSPKKIAKSPKKAAKSARKSTKSPKKTAKPKPKKVEAEKSTKKAAKLKAKKAAVKKPTKK